MKKIYILLLAVFFCGCSPQKRIVRIAEKHNLKQWEAVTIRDTVVIEPRTYIFQTGIDSVGDFYQEINGVQMLGNISNGIATVKVVTDFDTVYIEKEVEIQTITIEKAERKSGRIFGSVVSLLGCLCIVFFIIKQK
jgi:hypothetical protein